MEAADPLTKAKLFASHESGEWTEIGLGVVSVTTQAVPLSGADCHPPAPGGGKRGKAGNEESGTKEEALLRMFSLDGTNELLLSSFVSLEDIYTIQNDTILMWYEDSACNDIACSFNSKDGCDLIYRQIKAFQQAERLRRVQDERVPSIADKFQVHQRNLAAILEAAESQNKRFGLYVREDVAYFSKLAGLFEGSHKIGDTKTMELVARVVLALLQTPFSSDGKIISQFVENDMIDKCIDIVQFALGRRDKASGFVSFDERRATFHDPCNLPAEMKTRIHVLYSCGFLKDLLPLSLEPADASSFSLLSTFTLRFTMSMLNELCTSPTILPSAFEQAVAGVRLDTPGVTDPASIEPSKVAHLFELAAFVGEIAKTVKNAMISIDMRTEIFSSLVHAGLLTFLTTVLECALRYYSPPESYAVPQWVVRPPRAVQLVCDTLYSCATHFPECLEDLVAESRAAPQRCLLRMLLHALVTVRTSAEAQSVVDAVQCCGVGVPLTLAMFGENAQLAARRHEVLRFWVEGEVVDDPPLYHLATHIVSVLGDGAASASSAGVAGTGVLSSSGVVQLSTVAERQVVYSLRVITAIISKIDTTRCSSLMEVMTHSKVIPALAGTLSRPLRRLANLQSSVTSFVAAVLDRRDARLVDLVASDGVNLLHAAIQLFLQCSHRDNILSSSLAHLLAAVCDGVHREKLNDSSTLSSASSLGSRPFVTFLRGEDSISKTEEIAPAASTTARPFESVASAVLAQFGERLAVAAPVLYGRLQKALEETPAQAQQAEAETSSIASSMDRSAMPNFSDFDTAAIDFALEPPLRTPALDAVTEERLSSLTRSLTASDDDDDLLDDLSSIEPDSDNEEADATATALGSSARVAGDDSAAAAATSAPSPTAAPVLASSSSSPLHSGSGPVPPTTSSSSSAVAGAASFAAVDSIDPPSGRGSMLEDEENRLPKRLSVKRGRADTDRMENEEEEDEAETKRMKPEESAA